MLVKDKKWNKPSIFEWRGRPLAFLLFHYEHFCTSSEVRRGASKTLSPTTKKLWTLRRSAHCNETGAHSHIYSQLPLNANLKQDSHMTHPVCSQVGISEQSTFNFLVSKFSRFIIEVNLELTVPRALQQHFVTKPQQASIEAGKQLQSSQFFLTRAFATSVRS